MDHMLRRYESIGREGAVLKDMATALPESLQSLYSLMVDECRRRRTPEELDTLRHLFYWLAFSTRQLTLREVSGLIALTAEEGSFSLEEELNGKSSRYYAISVLLSHETHYKPGFLNSHYGLLAATKSTSWKQSTTWCRMRTIKP